jgi:hypothetical protein
MSEVDPGGQVPLPAPPVPRYYPRPPAPPPVLKPISPWVWIGAAVVVLALIGAAFPLYRLFHTQWHKADPIIAALHAQMAKGDDAGIFAQSDPAYQAQVGVTKSNELFDHVRQQLGAPHSSTCISQNISSDSKFGETLTLVFQTDFDKGTGTETLRMHKVGGAYKLLGYYVRSPQIPQDAVPADLRVQK